MKITIAICTWNRSRLLRQTLDSLTRLTIPQDVNWEIVLVDNNSTDDTKTVAGSFAESLPLRYVFERGQGHSQSRNTAVKNADGELIIWTDNDVIVEPDWLANYFAAAKLYSDISFFGGRIEPVFEQPKPDWLESAWQKCRPVYAYRDLGFESFGLGADQFPYGANFAIRSEVQKRFLFDVETGRSGDSLLGGDEIRMLERVVAAGESGMWLGNVGLKHVIPKERATEEYVSDYFYGQGKSNIQANQSVFRSSLHAFWAAKFNAFWYRRKRNSRPPEEWVSHMIRSSIARGEYFQRRTSR